MRFGHVLPPGEASDLILSMLVIAALHLSNYIHSGRFRIAGASNRGDFASYNVSMTAVRYQYLVFRFLLDWEGHNKAEMVKYRKRHADL